MNNIHKIGLVAVIVIAIVGTYLFPQVRGVVTFGAFAGPTILEHVEFKQGFTKGGTVVSTTTTAATYTLTTAEIRPEVSYISWLLNTNATVTTMASSSAPLSSLGVGESFSIYLYNASTTAASALTLAAGTGVDLQKPQGGVVIVNGLEMAKLTFLKKSSTDVILWAEVNQLGD